MRSTSITPPLSSSSSTKPSTVEEDDEDFVVIRELIRTFKEQGTTSTKPLVTPRSPSNKQSVRSSPTKSKSSHTTQQAKMQVDDAMNESEVKRGKKRARLPEDDDGKDERLISQELELEVAKEEDDDKGVGSSSSPKKRGYKIFTVEEDKLIVEQ
ncbi:hypothetical protein [Sporisorium scitamineum]|nr:hypothetical protein [Sporisorium scitamineum]